MSCTVSSKTNIRTRDVKVTSICGGSTVGIKVFYALSKVIRYIPKNIENVFKDLIGFRLENTELKMVTKEDLAPFPGLLMFASVSNHIEFLEEDLFINNPNLQYVSFRANKITYIHPSVFTVISGSLKQLYMDAQAINCGIGNPTTPAAIDVFNAPALYSLWLELKAQVSGGSDELDTCNNDLQTCQADLSAKDGEIQEKQAQIDDKDQQISDKDSKIQDQQAQIDEKDGIIVEKEATIQEKDDEMQGKENLIVDIATRLGLCCANGGTQGCSFPEIS
jgi:hypothetical protein